VELLNRSVIPQGELLHRAALTSPGYFTGQHFSFSAFDLLISAFLAP
jgi:hypothetical protein